MKAMSDARDTQALSERVAVLEERMNTLQADLSATLERFRADMAAHREDAAKRWEDVAKRDKDNQRWTVGFGIAQVVLTVALLGAGFAFLGILIGLPP